MIKQKAALSAAIYTAAAAASVAVVLGLLWLFWAGLSSSTAWTLHRQTYEAEQCLRLRNVEAALAAAEKSSAEVAFMPRDSIRAFMIYGTDLSDPNNRPRLEISWDGQAWKWLDGEQWRVLAAAAADREKFLEPDGPEKVTHYLIYPKPGSVLFFQDAQGHKHRINIGIFDAAEAWRVWTGQDLAGEVAE